MIQITKKENCCGCGACAQSCPRNCITMSEDDEGFIYPQVEQDKCIHCGLCEKACPIKNYICPENTVKAAYAAYAKDDGLRAASSSGGLFSLLAEAILDQGGVVFGAAYDQNLSVHHIAVESKANLGMLRKSKYLQSKTEDTYLETKKALLAGRKVLYTGTGCQINGLKRYLGPEPDGLYTVEVACHGVPSPKLWGKYVQSLGERCGASVTHADFRNKEKNGWKKNSIEFTFKNGEKRVWDADKDAYMQCFYNDISLRPSCYACRFKGTERNADLMIGDCWGIEKLMPDMDDDRGTSLLVVYSEKGRELLKLIEDKLVLRQGDVNKLLRANLGAIMPTTCPSARGKFMCELAAGTSLNELAKIARPTFFFRVRRRLRIYYFAISLSLQQK